MATTQRLETQREISFQRGLFTYTFKVIRREWEGGMEVRVAIYSVERTDNGFNPSTLDHWAKLPEQERKAIMNMAEKLGKLGK